MFNGLQQAYESMGISKEVFALCQKIEDSLKERFEEIRESLCRDIWYRSCVGAPADYLWHTCIISCIISESASGR